MTEIAQTKYWMEKNSKTLINFYKRTKIINIKKFKVK